MNMKLLHILVGLLTVLVFLATGMYMQSHFPAIHEANEVIRYQFRANHIYVLLSGLINLLAALKSGALFTGWRLVTARVASIFLLLAPAVLIYAFYTEPAQASADRPLTFYGVVLLLAGVLLTYLPLARRQ